MSNPMYTQSAVSCSCRMAQSRRLSWSKVKKKLLSISNPTFRFRSTEMTPCLEGREGRFRPSSDAKNIKYEQKGRAFFIHLMTSQIHYINMRVYSYG